MTGEVIITSQKKLGYDIDDGVITDALESVLILSTSHEPRWKYVNGFSDSLVMSYDDVINPEDKYAYNSELAQRVAQLGRGKSEYQKHLFRLRRGTVTLRGYCRGNRALSRRGGPRHLGFPTL